MNEGKGKERRGRGGKRPVGSHTQGLKGTTFMCNTEKRKEKIVLKL